MIGDMNTRVKGRSNAAREMPVCLADA